MWGWRCPLAADTGWPDGRWPIKMAMDKQHEFVPTPHELRTPLSLIRANAEILKREADKPVGEH
jgi:hypothetical protein